MLLSNITTVFSKKAINFNSIANLRQNAKLNSRFNLSLFRYWLLHCLYVLTENSVYTNKTAGKNRLLINNLDINIIRQNY